MDAVARWLWLHEPVATATFDFGDLIGERGAVFASSGGDGGSVRRFFGV